MHNFENFRNIGVFKRLDDDEFEAFISIGKGRLFNKGDVIFNEGDIGNSFFFIETGEVQITKDVPVIGPQILSILKSGEHFGEIILPKEMPRYFSAIAQTNLSLFEVKREDFHQLLDENIEISYKVLWFFCSSLSHSLRVINERLKGIFSVNAL